MASSSGGHRWGSSYGLRRKVSESNEQGTDIGCENQVEGQPARDDSANFSSVRSRRCILTRAPRIISFLNFLLVTLLSVATIANAQTARMLLEKLPYSGGVLMSRAIRDGRLHLPGGNALLPLLPPAETCSPAPCVLPNVNVFPSSAPVNDVPVVVNHKNIKQLLTGSNDYSCGTFLGFNTSNDGGATWSHTCFNTVSGTGYGDPGVAYDLKGVAYIIGIDSAAPAIDFEKSTNNGTSWSAPAVAVPSLNSGLTDKPWLEIDTNPTSKLKNSLYISITQFDPNNDSRITLTYSHDGGKTWKLGFKGPLQTFPGSVDQFSDIAIGADGTVYLTWQRCPTTGSAGDCGGTTATLYLTKSADGGKTWTKPHAMFKTNLVPDGCGCAFYGSLPNTSERIANIPVIAVDDSPGPHKGNLYVAYYNWTGAYMKMMVATSTNGGTTWTSRPVAPVSDKHDQFFQWNNVNSMGVVGVSFMDRRNDPANINYEAFAAFSTDGGTSFGKNVDLSSAPSNPFNDGFGGGFIGDHTGNGWAGLNTLYITFTDTTAGADQDFLGGYIR